MKKRAHLLLQRSDLVISPAEREFIMPTGDPYLAGWPLSGSNADQEAFHQQLLSRSQPHGDPRQLHHMNFSLENGTAGVWNGIEIPLEVL